LIGVKIQIVKPISGVQRDLSNGQIPFLRHRPSPYSPSKFLNEIRSLVQLIAVLVIVGIRAVLAWPKFYDMTDSAKRKALISAVAELNSQAILSVFLSVGTRGRCRRVYWI